METIEEKAIGIFTWQGTECTFTKSLLTQFFQSGKFILIQSEPSEDYVHFLRVHRQCSQTLLISLSSSFSSILSQICDFTPWKLNFRPIPCLKTTFILWLCRPANNTLQYLMIFNRLWIELMVQHELWLESCIGKSGFPQGLLSQTLTSCWRDDLWDGLHLFAYYSM